jgi:hypothetical protein
VVPVKVDEAYQIIIENFALNDSIENHPHIFNLAKSIEQNVDDASKV